MNQSLNQQPHRRGARALALWLCVLGIAPFSVLSTRAEQSALPVPGVGPDGLPAAILDQTIVQMQRARFEIGPKYVYVCRRLASFLTEYCGNVVYRYTAFPLSVTTEPLVGKPAGVRYLLHYAIQGDGSAFPALTLGGVAGQRFHANTALAVDVRYNPERPGCPTTLAEPNWVIHPAVLVANGVPASLDDPGDAHIKATLGTTRSNIQQTLGCR